ncbi:oxidoreductase [Flagelloscypha sp. PMI_526]|nr:oxidoreductase [Flagelloscypha sp. PMI_526]
MAFFPFAKPSPTTAVVLTLLSVVIIIAVWPKKSRWDAKGKHCYVTGASSGLGKELAILLAEKGAHVSIVARDKEKLVQTIEALKKARLSESQKFHSYSFSLDSASASAQALNEACQPFGGHAPDAVFLCAGTATPGFFVEETEESLKKGMEDNYWAQAWSALATAKRFAKENKLGGRLAFVSSQAAFTAHAGYASFAPGKHAIKGLAETLRSELLLYSTWVHVYFPPRLLSPGFKESEKIKPYITRKIEEVDQGMRVREAAEGFLYGVEKGTFQITNDLVMDILRTSSRGYLPVNTVILDVFYTVMGLVS